jgi:hypothetical protein
MPLSTIFQLYHGSQFLVEETGVPGENQRPAASHRQTLSHNIVHLVMSCIRIHNISGDRQIQLPYDRDHDGPSYSSLVLKESCLSHFGTLILINIYSILMHLSVY